jgi:hypothetical protein
MKTHNTSTALNSNSIFISEELKDRIDIDDLINDKDNQESQVDYGSFSVNIKIDDIHYCYDVSSVNFDTEEIVIEVSDSKIKELFIPFSEKRIVIESFNFKNEQIGFSKDSYIKMIKKSNNSSYCCIIRYVT